MEEGTSDSNTGSETTSAQTEDTQTNEPSEGPSRARAARWVDPPAVKCLLAILDTMYYTVSFQFVKAYELFKWPEVKVADMLRVETNEKCTRTQQNSDPA